MVARAGQSMDVPSEVHILDGVSVTLASGTLNGRKTPTDCIIVGMVHTDKILGPLCNEYIMTRESVILLMALLYDKLETLDARKAQQ